MNGLGTFAGMELANVFFRPYGAFRLVNPASTATRCPLLLREPKGLRRKDFRLKMVPLLIASGVAELSDCREQPDLADAQERSGVDFRICGMLTAATYPEDTVLSRAVSRKIYQEEN